MGVLADVILVLHACVVVFAGGGFVLIWVGGLLGWRWVRRRRFRIAHLALVGFVALQALLGVLCPLTALEGVLRQRAGESGYSGSFVGYWVGRLLCHDWPAWVFSVLYVAVAGLTAAAWFVVRPQRRRP